MKEGHQRLFEQNNKQILDDFSTHIMGNIYWYEKRIVEEKALRLTYILISFALLLFVPIGVVFIEKLSESVPAEITAILTGFFALYQGVSKWLESRSGIAIFWQTKSNLKSRMYSIRDKWRIILRNKELEFDDYEIELINDLAEAIKFGIENVKTEKIIFFENYSYPQFNVLGIILGVRGQVGQLFQQSDKKSPPPPPPPPFP